MLNRAMVIDNWKMSKVMHTGARKVRARVHYAAARLRALGPSHRPAVDLEIIRAVLRRRLTYLDRYALLELGEVVHEAGRQGLDGILLEAGCALGGSAIVMARAKARQMPLQIHDVFGMIPSPSEEDDADIHQRYQEIVDGQSRGLGGDRYYGYEEDLYAQVQSNLEGFSLSLHGDHITLVRGLFEDTLTGDKPVAVAHIDCDWYQSVKTCLLEIWPRLVRGGTLVIDDYFHWSGCRRAVDEFVGGLGKGEYSLAQRSRLHIVRR